MKILLVNGAAFPRIGGVENSLRFISQELLRDGHKVKVFCYQLSPDEPLLMVHEGVEIIRSHCKQFRWPHAQLKERVKTAQQNIDEVLHEFQPDAIWSRSAPVGLGIRRSGYSGPLLQIFCTNAKMNCRGSYLQTHGLPIMRRLKLLGLWPSAYVPSLRFERELARQCIPVAFSENMRQQLISAFPKEARTCHVIPPGVDTEVFSPERGARYFDTIEREYGLRHSENIVLYVGRLSSAKNIPLLMDAVSLLDTRLKLVLVGSGPEEERLKIYARRIGLADRLVFAGTQHEMLPGFYSLSRVCVLPTTTESFGQVYLESLASGTPAVGFKGDGCRVLTATDEIVQDGVTGGVVCEVSSKALAEKIESIILLDDNEYTDMSRRARDDVRARFSWRKFVDEALILSANYQDITERMVWQL